MKRVQSPVLCLLLLHCISLHAADVPRYEIFEVVLTSTKTYANPFADVTVTATFSAPSGKTMIANAFYDGGSTWRVRVAPDELGAWSYATVSSDTTNIGLHSKTGTFSCVSSSNKGFIRTDPMKKYYFSYSDGSAFYGVGDTCYGMVNAISNTERTTYLNTRSQQKLNFVRFFASGYPFKPHTSLSAQDAWPWGGSSSAPDYDRLNPQYFQRLESIIAELKSRGMHAEVEVFTYYSLPFTNPGAWTAPRQNLWAKYLLSRLSANSTVFLWTVTNEYELYSNGAYHHDDPADSNWAKSMGALFHANDPHKHPTTVHNFTFDTNGGIGGRFGSSADIDVLTHQKWGDATWSGQFLNGTAAGIEQAIWTDRTFNKPVINTENGYEWLSGYPHSDNQAVNGTDKCRKAAWRVFAAGGAAYAAGFQGTWRGTSQALWLGLTSPFRVEDMGLAAQLGYYGTFITSKTDFRSLSPAQILVNTPNLCLANTGSEYVVYAPSGGTVTLNLSSVSGSFSVQWFNPRTGVYTNQPAVSGGASRSFAAPDANDWVLYLKVGSASDNTPFGGIAWAVPGTIQAENFDNGGENVAYHDVEISNLGSQYRASDGVDIQATTDTGGGFNVGWTRTSEWLEYTVNVAATATYTVEVRVASNGNGGTFHLEFNGVNKTGTLTVPSTGGWQTWQTVTKTGVSLTSGVQIMRLMLDANGASGSIGNINYIRITAPTNLPPSLTSGPTANPNPATPGQTVSFTAAASDANGDALSYSWNFGDGTSGTGSSVAHAYGSAGAYTAVVTVNDGHGGVVSGSIAVTISTTQTPGLVGFWTLDDTADDASGNGNHGALMNGPIWVDGNVGGALSFDSVDDRMQVPDSASLDLTSQGTISVWIFPRSFPNGYATVLEKMSGGGQGAGYQLLLGASNTAGLWLMSGGTSSNIQSDANLYAFNSWTHVAVTWNGSTIQFYKNGQPFGVTRVQPRNAAANTLPLVLGVDTGFNGRLNGVLDEVILFNRALSGAEIEDLATGTP